MRKCLSLNAYSWIFPSQFGDKVGESLVDRTVEDRARRERCVLLAEEAEMRGDLGTGAEGYEPFRLRIEP